MEAQEKHPLRERLFIVIFGTETPGGRAFDVALLMAILASVFALMLESVPQVARSHRQILRATELVLTGLFTVEYGLRLYAVRRPMRYVFSFFGVVDLISILPTYVSLFVPGAHVLTVVRALRLLRVFRVLKLVRFMREGSLLLAALLGSLRKITVFLGGVLTLVTIVGTLMYWIEGDRGEFSSIPKGVYWAIVTLTTVGYGDIVPVTVPGKILASIVMILGYGVIAVPTGIVSAELVSAARDPHHLSRLVCLACEHDGHDIDAKYCKYCGEALRRQEGPTTAASPDLSEEG
jgi:voltage-gated potassium channel